MWGDEPHPAPTLPCAPLRRLDPRCYPATGAAACRATSTPAREEPIRLRPSQLQSPPLSWLAQPNPRLHSMRKQSFFRRSSESRPFRLPAAALGRRLASRRIERPSRMHVAAEAGSCRHLGQGGPERLGRPSCRACPQILACAPWPTAGRPPNRPNAPTPSSTLPSSPTRWGWRGHVRAALATSSSIRSGS